MPQFISREEFEAMIAEFRAHPETCDRWFAQCSDGRIAQFVQEFAPPVIILVDKDD